MLNWLRKIKNIINGDFYFKQIGHCPCCENDTYFISYNPWLRDYFKCMKCDSIPRERALMTIINREFPNWQDLIIHESSPINRGHSQLLSQKAKSYIPTQFFPSEPMGKIIKKFRNEDLENQTFPDESFDLVVTSDVMEHIYEPDKAFKEIHRTLKPRGAHIFTTPLVNKHTPSVRWAIKGENGEPNFLYEPEWHGNPVNKQGSAVTFHWGYDIKDYIEQASGAEVEIVYLNDLKHGIRAEYIEVIIARKP